MHEWLQAGAISNRSRLPGRRVRRDGRSEDRFGRPRRSLTPKTRFLRKEPPRAVSGEETCHILSVEREMSQPLF